jgi:TPP-dependent indolepyruvate ferredoxin oxidoreductase alpha subunit
LEHAYLSGVMSKVQTQSIAKQALNRNLTAVAGYTTAQMSNLLNWMNVATTLVMGNSDAQNLSTNVMTAINTFYGANLLSGVTSVLQTQLNEK